MVSETFHSSVDVGFEDGDSPLDFADVFGGADFEQESNRHETIAQLELYYGTQKFQYGSYAGTITDIAYQCPAVGNALNHGFDAVQDFVSGYEITDAKYEVFISGQNNLEEVPDEEQVIGSSFVEQQNDTPEETRVSSAQEDVTQSFSTTESSKSTEAAPVSKSVSSAPSWSSAVSDSLQEQPMSVSNEQEGSQEYDTVDVATELGGVAVASSEVEIADDDGGEVSVEAESAEAEAAEAAIAQNETVESVGVSDIEDTLAAGDVDVEQEVVAYHEESHAEQSEPANIESKPVDEQQESTLPESVDMPIDIPLDAAEIQPDDEAEKPVFVDAEVHEYEVVEIESSNKEIVESIADVVESQESDMEPVAEIEMGEPESAEDLRDVIEMSDDEQDALHETEQSEIVRDELDEVEEGAPLASELLLGESEEPDVDSSEEGFATNDSEVDVVESDEPLAVDELSAEFDEETTLIGEEVLSADTDGETGEDEVESPEESVSFDVATAFDTEESAMEFDDEVESGNEQERYRLQKLKESIEEIIAVRLPSIQSAEECNEVIGDLESMLAELLAALGYDEPERVAHSLIYNNQFGEIKELLEKHTKDMYAQASGVPAHHGGAAFLRLGGQALKVVSRTLHLVKSSAKIAA